MQYAVWKWKNGNIMQIFVTPPRAYTDIETGLKKNYKKAYYLHTGIVKRQSVCIATFFPQQSH